MSNENRMSGNQQFVLILMVLVFIAVIAERCIEADVRKAELEKDKTVEVAKEETHKDNSETWSLNLGAGGCK